MGMLTRGYWDALYSDRNLLCDRQIQAAPPSKSAARAAAEFRRREKRRILDLSCGLGRDTFLLESSGLTVFGADVSLSGLRAAHQEKLTRGAVAEFAAADARSLPFGTASFDGIYCFGLLHLFTGAHREKEVGRVLSEIGRVLSDRGLLALTVLAGYPEDGLPEIQLFTRTMFERAMDGWNPLEIAQYEDVGCTQRGSYPVWYGVFEKPMREIR